MDKVTRSWMLVAASAAAILALLAAVGLPLLFPALNRPAIRFGLIAVIAIGFVVAVLWRRWRGTKASGEIADGLATPTPGEAEADALAGRMREALTQLKNSAQGNRDYLYGKPWYIIIGPPGAGKTTALTGSGVRFPWNDAALGGVGGTRNLDFWFADQAVLVDTAGRYTTQDSETAVDAAGWKKFLGLLRRTRPLQPINGVLVTFGLDELMSSSREQLDAHSAAIRRRLAELRRILGIAVPVYVIFSKADLLAGFEAFFADLDAEGRRAVLGTTFPLREPHGNARVVAEFDRMAEAVAQRSAKRLQDERDQTRRSLILGFPAQIVSLRARFARFIEGVFPDQADPDHLLRGFYLTSGTQEGAPLDRVLSAVAAVFEQAPGDASRPVRGRAFFLNRLLNDVVFQEAGLVQMEPALKRRRRILWGATVAALAAVSLVVVALWIVSFSNNRKWQNALLAASQTVNETMRTAGINTAEVGANDADLEQVLPVLDQLRTLPHGYAGPEAGRAMRFGLYQAGDAESARQAYLEALQRILLPRILLRLEDVLRQDTAKPIDLYEPLKVYLMLGGYGPLDPQAVRTWVENDWRAGPLSGEDRADIRARLGTHLDALLADPDFGRVWPHRQAPLDGQLIATTRAAVQSLSLADRAYAALRQRSAVGGPAWRADRVLTSGDANAFRNGASVLAMTVPWFFTADGYRLAYQPGLSNVESELDRDLWVLGADAGRASIRDQLPALRAAVANDYAADYIKAWDGVLSTPQAANYFGDNRALGAFTRTPSPLKTLLLEVRRNTSLGGGSGGGTFDAGQAIRAHFAQVADFAGAGAGASAPVDTLVKAIQQAASATAASNAPGAALSGGAVQGQVATALGGLSTAGVVAPPQLQNFVTQATRSGQGAATQSAETALNQQYSSMVRPACLAVTQGRYPFDHDAQAEIAAADLQRVYGANGDIDGFVRQRLQPILDASAPTWRWKAGDPVAARFTPASAAEFQKAGKIRDLTMGGLSVSVSLASIGRKIDAVEVSSGGTTYRFGKRDMGPKPLIWSPSALPEAHVALLDGKKVRGRADASGAWALFRLIDRGAPRTTGPGLVTVSYGAGDTAATLAIRLPSSDNPFGRTGPFSFRCPERL